MRYKFETRLGNWYERKVLEETKVKDFVQKRSNQQLQCDHEDRIMKVNYEPVDLLTRKDGCLRFGDKIMIQSQFNHTYLVCDVT